jgi:chromate reductase, NAD(P)H dehydrogenase (quinone)
VTGGPAAVLALSGSLRASSSNAALLRAAMAAAPAALAISFDEQAIAALPHFNPDLDVDPPPAAVAAFRAQLAAAEGLILCSPEYAHGVPGALKDALDWIVSSGELMDKPILLLNASPAGGTYAQASLAETLTVMSAAVLPASLTAPFLRRKLDGRGPIAPADEAQLKVSLEALAAAIAARRAALAG